MTNLQYTLLFLIVAASGLLYFAFKNLNQRILKLTLSFSAAYLFALSVLHLVPEVYHSSDLNIGIYVLAGFFIQIIIEFFSEGIEHGHIHLHHKQNLSFPVGMMFGLCIHSFIEGMPLSGKFLQDESRAQNLLTGIILHHAPVAFALMSMLLHSGISKKIAVFCLLLFAMMAPVGALFTNFFGEYFTGNTEVLFERMMAIVIGIFLHISTTILFESGNEHRFNLYKLFTIVCGATLAWLL
jgi:zinc transporter ZupT